MPLPWKVWGFCLCFPLALANDDREVFFFDSAVTANVVPHVDEIGCPADLFQNAHWNYFILEPSKLGCATPKKAVQISSHLHGVGGVINVLKMLKGPFNVEKKGPEQTLHFEYDKKLLDLTPFALYCAKERFLQPLPPPTRPHLEVKHRYTLRVYFDQHVRGFEEMLNSDAWQAFVKASTSWFKLNIGDHKFQKYWPKLKRQLFQQVDTLAHNLHSQDREIQITFPSEGELAVANRAAGIG